MLPMRILRSLRSMIPLALLPMAMAILGRTRNSSAGHDPRWLLSRAVISTSASTVWLPVPETSTREKLLVPALVTSTRTGARDGRCYCSRLPCSSAVRAGADDCRNFAGVHPRSECMLLQGPLTSNKVQRCLSSKQWACKNGTPSLQENN